MANWNNPTTTSNYSTGVLQVLKDRDFDAISLCLNDPTNMIDGMLKLVRSPKIKFQERVSSAWVDKVLDIEGGGTGANTASGSRTALGLGTMAVQDSSSVSISGGTLAGSGSGLTSLSAANITSGGTLPALVGTNLTALNASNLASGTVNVARLGSGASSTKFLRGDNTWQDVTVVKSVQQVFFDANLDFNGDGERALDLSTTLTDYTKSAIVALTINTASVWANVISNTQFKLYWQDTGGGTQRIQGCVHVVEFKNVG